jgi:hypothetical protein
METTDGAGAQRDFSCSEDGGNLASRLDQERQALRSRFQTRSLTSEERQAAEDIAWAQQDPDVQAKHRGEFVVPYRRTIVAHGHDVATILGQAAAILGRRSEDIPIVGVMDPLLDIPR